MLLILKHCQRRPEIDLILALWKCFFPPSLFLCNFLLKLEFKNLLSVFFSGFS